MTPGPASASDDRAAFERFAGEAGPRLGRALAAVYGFEDGRDATAEALAYAWENWQRLRHIANLPGYLFRVGQTRGRRRRQPVLFDIRGDAEYTFEPGLPKALAALTQRQRLAVVLVHGYGYTLREVAELTGSGPGRRRLSLAGAAGIAAGAVLAVAVLLPGSASRTGQARLTAWTVAKQPDGSVLVTLHEVRDPASLQRALRADGIPARVFVNRQHVDSSLDVPGCRVYPAGVPGGTPAAVWQRVFYGQHTNVRSYTFWVYPSAIPSGRGVVVVIHYGPAKLSSDYRNHPVGTDLGYGVDSYSLYLVDATPECTGP